MVLELGNALLEMEPAFDGAGLVKSVDGLRVLAALCQNLLATP
jgi:hypothetical protein